MRHGVAIFVASLCLSSCEASGQRATVDFQSTSENKSSGSSGVSDPEAEDQVTVGAYRWSYWIGQGATVETIQNKRGEFFRLHTMNGLSADDPRVGRQFAEAELKIPTKGPEPIYFVIDGVTHHFEVRDGNVEEVPRFLLARTIDALRASEAGHFCVELPRSDYRTCFSTSDLSDASDDGTEAS